MKKWHTIYEHSGRVNDYLQEALDNGESEPALPEDEMERKVAERLLQDGYLYRKGKEQQMFNAEVAFARLRRHLLMRRLRWGGGIAAVMALMLGCWFLWQPGEEDDTLVLAERYAIMPGGSKATLTLPGGEVMALNDTAQASVQVGDGRLRIDSSRIACEVDSMKAAKGKMLYSVLSIPRGGEYCLMLADGSQVWLNSETELRFPLHFSGDCREVYLKGEGYFDVKSDAAKPFIVHTEAGDVKVLGTAFNVSVYRSDAIVATLERGAISYVGEDGEETRIRPGEQLTYQSGGGEPLVREVNTRPYTTWKDHLFSFEEQRLDDIMEILARWYDFQVFFESEELKGLEFSGTLDKYSNISPLLELFELSGRIKFDVNKNTIVVKR